MKQGGGYVIFVDNLIKFHVEVCTKIILTLWCMSCISVMHCDTQNGEQPFSTLYM
jgi:hypothetical protein